jgi:hypothetical protein
MPEILRSSSYAPRKLDRIATPLIPELGWGRTAFPKN